VRPFEDFVVIQLDAQKGAALFAGLHSSFRELKAGTNRAHNISVTDPSFQDKVSSFAEEKRHIARAAAE
jgi:hypothetical protein